MRTSRVWNSYRNQGRPREAPVDLISDGKLPDPGFRSSPHNYRKYTDQVFSLSVSFSPKFTSDIKFDNESTILFFVFFFSTSSFNCFFR